MRPAAGIHVFCQPGFLHARMLAAPPTHRLPAPFDRASVDFYLRGSTALYHGLRLSLRHGATVLFPAYHCGIELDVLIKAGLRPEFYRVGRDLQIDPAELRRIAPPATCALFVIHYFGFPHAMGPLRELCAERGWLLIEDCAHAMFAADAAGPVGTIGDIAVFSFHKALPVPCGGALAMKDDGRARAPASERPRFGFVAQLTLDVAGRDVVRSALVRTRAGRRLRAFVDARMHDGRHRRLGVDADGSIAFRPEWARVRIPAVSRWVLRRIDPAQVAARRRTNFARVLAATRGCRRVVPLLRALADGACPGFFPATVVGDRDAFLEFCQARGVGAHRFWPRLHPAFPAERFADDVDLKRRAVVLPVHQDLTADDLALVTDVLIAWEHASP